MPRMRAGANRRRDAAGGRAENVATAQESVSRDILRSESNAAASSGFWGDFPRRNRRAVCRMLVAIALGTRTPFDNRASFCSRLTLCFPPAIAGRHDADDGSSAQGAAGSTLFAGAEQL